MADNRNLGLQLKITADDAASPKLQRLSDALTELGTETQVIADGMAESASKADAAFDAIADSAQSAGEVIDRDLVAELERIESPQGVAELQQEMQSLQQSGRDAGDEMERLGDTQQRLDRLADAAGQSEAALNQELQRQRMAAQDAADAADGLGDASGRSTKAFVDHRKESGALGDALSDVADRFGLSGEAFDGLTGQLAKGAAIALLAKQFMDANNAADQLAKQFRAMTGDAETAAQEIDFLKDVANRWGVSVNDLAPAYLRLAAATKGSTAEGEKTRQMIDDLTAAYMNAGAGVGDIEEAMEILGETFAEGRVSIDAIKEGMQEDMPPAIQAATTAVLENDTALKKMLETGDAATEDFMPAFAAALREHIGGSTTHIDSMSASFTRTVAALNELLVKFDDSVPLMALFDGATRGVVKTFETLISGASIVVDGFNFVGRAVGAATGALATGEDALAAMSEEAERTGASIEKTALHLIGLKTASEESAIRQEQMKKELQALREEMDPYGAELEALKKKLEDAAKEFEKTGDAIKLTQTALEAFFAAPEQNLDVDGVLKLAAALKTVGDQAESSGQQISNTLGQELAKLSHEQLATLERQARAAMAAASEGSETSRIAFAQLGQIIEGVVLARLQKLGVDGPEALHGISTAATEAIANFHALAESGVLSADGIQAAFAGALQQLDNPKELEQFREHIITLGEDGVLTGEQVDQALLQIRQRIQEVATDPAFTALQKALTGIREETEKGIEAGQREHESLQNRTQSAIELAKAKGDEAEAARLSAAATKEEVDQAELRIQQLQHQQTEIDAHIQRLYAQANADGIYTEAERAVIEALQDKSVAIGHEIHQIEGKLPLMEREARQAELMAGPIGQLTRLYAEQAVEHQRAAEASERYHDTQVTEAEGALKLAEIRGDEAAKEQALIDVRAARIAQAENMAAIRAQEAADTEKAISAKVMEMAADQEWTAADQQAEDQLRATLAAKQDAAAASQQHADQLRAEAQASEEAAAAAKKEADAAQAAAEAADQRAAAGKAVNAQWGAANEVLAATGGNVEKLNAAFLRLQEEYARGRSGFMAFATATATAADEVAEAYRGQEAAINKAVATLEHYAETGEWTAEVQRAMALNSSDLDSRFNLLDEQDFDRLRGALDSANNKLREMQDETQSAKDRLAELNAELLEAQGQDQKAQMLREQLDYQQQLAEIEAQRAEAEALGNRELLAILNDQQATLEKIHTTKMNNLATESDAEGEVIDKTTRRYRELGTAIEGAHQGAKALASADLGNLLGQTDKLYQTLDATRKLL